MTISVVLAAVFILGTWVLLKYLMPQFFMDTFRDRLFVIRAELFNLVLEKKISSFDSSAYREMEFLINSLIRYSDKIRPSIFLAISLSRRKDMIEEIREQKRLRDRKLERSLSKLDNEQEELLRHIRRKVEVCLGWYFLGSSWTITLLFISVLALTLALSIPIVIFGGVLRLFGNLSKVIRLVKDKVISSLRFIEASAAVEYM